MENNQKSLAILEAIKEKFELKLETNTNVISKFKQRFMSTDLEITGMLLGQSDSMFEATAISIRLKNMLEIINQLLSNTYTGGLFTIENFPSKLKENLTDQLINSTTSLGISTSRTHNAFADADKKATAEIIRIIDFYFRFGF